MNRFDEYQRKVACFGHELGKRDNIAHAILGMMSEVGELRELYYTQAKEDTFATGIIEEQGDCWWFAAWYSTALECSLGQAVGMSYSVLPQQIWDATDCLDHMEMAGCAMLSEVKRHLFYKTDDYDYPAINESFLTYLRCLIKLGSLTEHYHHGTDVLEANFRKLSTRYPDKVFDPLSAVDRNTQAEYQSLEDTSGC